MGSAKPEGMKLKISVMIPTYRRPALLLKAIGSILDDCGTAEIPLIYVVDNDPLAYEGAKAATELAMERKITGSIRCVFAPNPGLANCRNAGIEAVFSDPSIDSVVMIDDDSFVAPGWWSAISAAASINDAEIIGGPTVYIVPDDCCDEVRQAPVFGSPFNISGHVPILRSSNNCLIRRVVYDSFEKKLFNIEFNDTGGEDTHFFRRASDYGHRFRWVNEAKINEPVPINRATVGWVMERHRLSAINAARVDMLLHGSFIGRLRQLALAAKESLSGVYWGVTPFGRDLCRSRYRMLGAAGRLSGIFGSRPKHH